MKSVESPAITKVPLNARRGDGYNRGDVSDSPADLRISPVFPGLSPGAFPRHSRNSRNRRACPARPGIRYPTFPFKVDLDPVYGL